MVFARSAFLAAFWTAALAFLTAPALAQTGAPPPAASLVKATNQVTAQQAQTQARAQAEAQLQAQLESQSAADGGLGASNGSPVATVPVMVPAAASNAGPVQDDSGTAPDPAASAAAPAPAPTTQETTEALQAALAQETARAAQQEAQTDAQRAHAEARMNERAYNSAVKGLFPMSGDQIKGVMHRLEDTQNASVPPSYGQPKPQVAVQTISLDPGVAPPEIDVAAGYVTTLTILDATGQPWPIIDIGVGGNFDIPAPESGGHIVRITPMTRYGYGNLSVRLKDLATPITFRLSAGGDIVHYRYDARIPRNGPNAKASLIERPKLTAGDDVIMAVLDNSIPSGAKKLKSDGTDRRTAAYKVGERTFVRTPLAMISPSWDASVASADGMTVYEIGDTPVVLLSDNGNLVRVRLSDDTTAIQ